ncbi:MAG: hypothetical protein HC803_08300 [Saprospiraceae bacterium]|nr:hypothetical protein [Saprospiraceae bacterium]
MNWIKANQLLSGIDRLCNIFQESEGLSSIERDLLLRRIQDLYEVVLDGDFEKPAPKEAKPEPPKVKETPKPEPIPQWTPPKRTETPKPVVEAPKPVIERPVVEMPKPMVETPKPIIETPKPVIETPKPPVVEKPKEIVYEPTIKGYNSDEIEELFEFKSAMDLSEKLSAAPISDLKNAMGN